MQNACSQLKVRFSLKRTTARMSRRRGGRGEGRAQKQKGERTKEQRKRHQLCFHVCGCFCACLSSVVVVVVAGKERIPPRVRASFRGTTSAPRESTVGTALRSKRSPRFSGAQHSPKTREANSPLNVSSLSLARPLYCSLTWQPPSPSKETTTRCSLRSVS